VSGDTLHLNQVVTSGGPFPASIGVHADSPTSSMAGSRLRRGIGSPAGSCTRSRIAALAWPRQRQPARLSAVAAQVGFSPDGSKLVITMKGNGGGSVYVYVSADGRLSDSPASQPSRQCLRLRLRSGQPVVIVNAAFGNLSTYTVNLTVA